MIVRRKVIEASVLTAEPKPLKSDWSHYLAYPARSAGLPAFTAFRQWLHGEAQRYAAGL